MVQFRYKVAAAMIALQLGLPDAQAQAPRTFVDVSAVVDGLVVDMRYFGTENFIGWRIDGSIERRTGIEPAGDVNGLPGGGDCKNRAAVGRCTERKA